MSDIYRAWMDVPQDIDGFSAPPKWYKPLLDASKRDCLEWAKPIIHAKFPAVTNVMLFHENASDMWGNMKVRFLYNNTPIEFWFTYQQAMNTITNQRFSSLSAHLQKMTTFERWIFNTILIHIHRLEQKWNPVKQKIHTAMDDLSSEIKTA